MAVQILNSNPPPVLINANSAASISSSNGGFNNAKFDNTAVQDHFLGNSTYTPNSSVALNETESRVNSQDKLSLSDQAQSVLGSNAGGSLSDSPSLIEGSLDSQSLDFRGLSQIATSRTLTPDEVTKVTTIRQNFADAGVKTDKDILKQAEKNLADLQTQSTNLVQLAQTGNITGAQFKQLHQINTALNKANGFGADQPADAAQTASLNKQLSSIADQSIDQTLSSTSLRSLGTLQQQISTLQGYRLSVNDSVGPNGLLV